MSLHSREESISRYSAEIRWQSLLACALVWCVWIPGYSAPATADKQESVVAPITYVQPDTATLSDTRSLQDIVALYPADGIRFNIYRNDRRVGSHTLGFSTEGGRLLVSIDSSIRITVLKIPVYTLRYTATEQWQEGRLLMAEATTTENGDAQTVSMSNEGNESLLSTLEGPDRVERLEYASNHWNAGILEAGRFFNTLTGEAAELSIKALGEETVATDSGTVTATHYQYSGDVVTEVWYDASNRWVGLAFDADDGSRIRYELIEE